MWRLKKDGEWYGPKWPAYADVWMSLFQAQPQSISHATRFEGWEIKRCSPLTRTGLRRGEPNDFYGIGG